MRYALVLWIILGIATAGQAVEFADPELAAAVQESGGETELTQLEAGGRGIRELGGIEQLQNLTSLALADNQVRDLRPLAALSSLTVLDLANNQVEDLSPLAGLGRLTYLNLEYNAVSDLAPLSGLEQLQVLVLDHNAAQDLSPLLGLPALAELSLLGNPLSATALSQQIPALQAKGVAVSFDRPEEGGEEKTPGAPDWRAVGPQVEPWSLGIYRIVAAPSDPQVLYALAQNGLWQSQDRGQTWEQSKVMFDDYYQDLLVSPLDPLEIYWTERDPASTGHEIMRSRDGGRHWERITSPQPEECRESYGSYTASPLIALDPMRSGRLYGFRCGELVISADGGQQWDAVYQQNGAPVHLEGSFFVRVHPADPQVIYAGFFHDSGRTFLSRSADGGRTWEDQFAITHPVLRALTPDPRHPNFLYAASEDSLFHSEDGGGTWTPLSPAPRRSLDQLIASPADPAVLLAWSGWVLGDAEPSGWRSEDSGVHWERLNLEEVSQVVPHPHDPRQLLAVTSSNPLEPAFLYRSRDTGRAWEPVEILAQARPVEVVQFDAQGTLYAGSGQWEGNRYGPDLWQSADKGAHWSRLLEEVVSPGPELVPAWGHKVGMGAIDGLYLDPHRPSSMLAYTLAWRRFLRSLDAGRTWTMILPGARQEGLADEPEILWLGSTCYLLNEDGVLYRSADGGENWGQINTLVKRAVAVPTERSRLYVVKWYDTQLSYSDDGGDTWTRTGKMPGLGEPLDLAVHPGAPGRLYGVNSTGLGVSEDGARTWTLLRTREEGELWLHPQIRFAPQDPGTIYLITGRYLFETTDGGQTWKSLGEGLGARAWFNDVAVDPANPSLVYAATPWGVYRWDKEEITAVEEEGAVQPASFALSQNYPNPFNPTTTIRFNLPQPGEAELAIYNLMGQRVAVLVRGVQEAGAQVLRWDGRDDAGRVLASGVYLCRLKAGAHQETRRLLLLK